MCLLKTFSLGLVSRRSVVRSMVDHQGGSGVHVTDTTNETEQR